MGRILQKNKERTIRDTANTKPQTENNITKRRKQNEIKNARRKQQKNQKMNSVYGKYNM